MASCAPTWPILSVRLSIRFFIRFIACLIAIFLLFYSVVFYARCNLLEFIRGTWRRENASPRRTKASLIRITRRGLRNLRGRVERISYVSRGDTFPYQARESCALRKLRIRSFLPPRSSFQIYTLYAIRSRWWRGSRAGRMIFGSTWISFSAISIVGSWCISRGRFESMGRIFWGEVHFLGDSISPPRFRD